MRIKHFLITGLLIFSKSQFGQNVNPFTGSFNYGQNVLYVPSNRGAGVNINISYNAGIRMEQPSSEIGLGWDINAGGAIYRNVSGIPDDMKNYRENNKYFNSAYDNCWGALYPNNNSSTLSDKADFYKTSKGLDSSEFTMPDFDQFNVSGPGLGGQMTLSYHKYYSYNYVNPVTWPPHYSYFSTNAVTFKKPQFHFNGDFSDTLTSRHYSTQINSSTPYLEPNDGVVGNGYGTSNIAPFIGKHLNGSTISSENFDSVTTRLGTSNFVEYFTNSEIDAANTAGFPSGPLATFVDYKSVHSRTNTEFPADGIGYFRIINANGLTYHYSLPVYHLGTTVYRVPLNNDYSVVSSFTVSDFNGNDRTYFPNNNNVLVKDSTANKYAVKWLLTAITGADYVDSNNDHLVNDGDDGYWINYDYTLWSKSFIERSPRYGYDYQFEPDETTQFLPQYYPVSPSSGAYKTSGLFGVSQISRTQVYHLNKIRTSSHTALFVRDIRNDEKGMSHDITIPSNFKPAPDLALKRIVLFKNEELDSIMQVIYPSGPSGSAFNTSNYSEFNFASVTNTLPNVYTENWFNSNFPNSNPNISSYSGNNYNFLILKNVYFDQDYSLCKGYHGNVKLNYNGSNVFKSQTDVAANVSNSSISSSGKLTLNKIYVYDFANQKVTPSVIFDYDQNQTLFANSNPNYNPKKTDYWGYYKSDATDNAFSRYTTSLSKANTKAWSLRRITDHLGGITEIEYESNSYVKVLDSESSTGVRGAAFVYRIASVKEGSNPHNFDIFMEEGNSSSNTLTEFSTLCGTSITNIKKRMCLPFMRSIAISSSAMTNTTNFIGYAFGSITSTILNVPSGTSNNIQGSLTPLQSTSTNSCYAWNDFYNLSGGSSRKFKRVDPGLSGFTNTVLSSWYGTYSGNGFLFFETPVGHEVYGGGIRVKTISSKNTINEVYVKEYTYSEGVATEEIDRFDYPRFKTRCAPPTSTDVPVYHYEFLKPKEYAKFDMSPMIGYSKVTIKDLGRINTDNGKVEISYITDPTYKNSEFGSNSNIVVVTKTVSGTPPKVKTLNECVDLFSNIFGSENEVKVYDKNGNMLSRTVNTYASTEQGALVENVHFYESNWFPNTFTPSVVSSHTVNIMRNIPVVLKNTTTYGLGGEIIKTETIARDELTRDASSMRAISKTSNTSYSFKTPVYKYLNLDFTSASQRRMIPLTSDMYSYRNVDSTLSGTLANGSSSSFLTSSYKLYTRLAKQRIVSSGVYTNTQITLPYYYNNRSFVFDAGPSSINSYGLLSKSTLTANPLPLSTMTSSVYWEPSSTYNWLMLSEITLLDKDKHVVETRDQNNRFNACKYGYKGYYKNSSVSNCNYASYTFADFETAPTITTSIASIDGDLTFNNPTLIDNTTLAPHTGLKCIQISGTPITYTVKTEKSPGNSLDVGFLPGRIYRASVWVSNSTLSKATLSVSLTGSVNGVYTSTAYAANSTNTIAIIDNWTCIQLDFSVASTFTTGASDLVTFYLKSIDGSAVYFDDFVMHPVESSFSGSVYNPSNGRLMSSIDGNGLATNYKYDAAGRVIEIWKEVPGVGNKLVKSYSYNYARGLNN